MNKKRIMLKSSLLMLTACLSVFSCLSCYNEDTLSSPRIESVWSNMSTQPIEQVSAAYHGQTVCLRGSGFKGVDKVTVNGYDIDLTENQIYNTDKTILFVIPVETPGSNASGLAEIRVSNSEGEAVFQPFYTGTEAEQPVITSIGATVLTPGSSLRIAGENLGGATEVYLPLAFDQKVKCELDPSQANSDTEVFIIVPDGVSFAQGRVEIVMNKVYAATGAEYVTKAYSDVTNFSN